MITEIIFQIAPALSAIFQLNLDFQENDFYEFTTEQYEKLSADQKNESASKKWYMFIPRNDPSSAYEVVIVTEDEKIGLIKAAQLIEKYAKESAQTFANHTEILQYVADQLPPVFSEKSAVIKRAKLQLVTNDKPPK
jgi:hypothetical protein